MRDQVAGEVARGSEEALKTSGEAAAASTMVYETDPQTGQTRLRPLDHLLVANFGAGNQAYNAAIMRNYAAAVDNDARSQFGEMQLRNAQNPQAFAAEAEGWINGTVQSLPERAREQIGMSLRATASQFALRIHEEVQRAAQQQIVGNQRTAIASIADDATALIASGAPESDRRVTQMRERYVQAVADAYRLAPLDFPPEKQRELLQAFDVLVRGRALANEALRAGSGAAGLQAIQRWRQNAGPEWAVRCATRSRPTRRASSTTTSGVSRLAVPTRPIATSRF